MSKLKVPGATIHYNTRGNGPAMVMIAGATGSAFSFQAVMDHLAAHYTVVTYDRRGFSRSGLDGPQDYDRRLGTDVDDVRRLIEHVSGGPATVFGSSSGAIVALDLLARHPSLVVVLVPHEPPAMRLLADGQKWIDFFFEIYTLYRQSGPGPALAEFREHAFPESDRAAMAQASTGADPGMKEMMRANAGYWFEHELRQYPAVELDLEAIQEHAGRILPAAGQETRGYPTHEVTLELARRIGREPVELVGGHIGFVNRPAEFARDLLRALAPPRKKS